MRRQRLSMMARSFIVTTHTNPPKTTIVCIHRILDTSRPGRDLGICIKRHEQSLSKTDHILVYLTRQPNRSLCLARRRRRRAMSPRRSKTPPTAGNGSTGRAPNCTSLLAESVCAPYRCACNDAASSKEPRSKRSTVAVPSSSRLRRLVNLLLMSISTRLNDLRL